MNEILNDLSKLRLDCLDDGWVTATHYSEFLEFGDFSSEYETVLETIDIRSTFKDIMKSFDTWLTTEEESNEEKSWAVLSHQVQHEKLLAILAYYIDYGSNNVLTKEYRNNALLASRVYYKLLSVPGYKAYHIYHSQLFAHSLGCLGFPKAMCDNDENYFNTKELTREVNSVIKELKYFVDDLRAVVEQLQLNPSDMNFEDILSNLVDITGGAIVNKLNVDKIELGNISRVIYEMIDILICDANKEPNGMAIRLLFKCLLPKLVAASVDCRSANNLVRASYVTYSGLLLSKYGKAALSGYTVLLEHLCYTLDGLERAEVRSARVSLVVGLMSLLPRKSYGSIVKWLLKLSTTAKISHRQIAMEMLANLLSNDPEKKKPEENVSEHTKNVTENSEAKEGDQQPSTSEVTSNVENQTADDTGIENDLQVTFSIITDDENTQDLPERNDSLEHEMTEDEIAGLFRQRPHTVPHAEILRAVYERLHDVSSTLRTRALVILTECLSSDRPPMQEAIKELNGDGSVSRLMAAGARCVCDERAAVRRAAAALVHRLLAAPAAPHPHEHDLGILVSLCRDASIIVRSAAIAALGELVTQKPSEAVIDAFLSGPMHQLSDPENKVQEQVVNLIQQLLMDRLQKYTVSGSEDPLPWMILEGITRHNMRRYLQKACTLLAKSSTCISPRLVDVASTHLGAATDARDLQCLVLLTSVAKLIDYSNIAFVLEYYYKLAEQNRDVRLMSLTLELTSSWSRFANSGDRATLRDHLVRRLAATGDDGCRIAYAALAAQLDPDNVQWATELMQLSERRALNGGDVEEWVRVADLSLVAPSPPSPAILRLFLTALADPPAEWVSDGEGREGGEGGGVRLGACAAGAGRLCVRARGPAAAAAPALAALLADARAPLPARLNALLALTDICTRYVSVTEWVSDGEGREGGEGGGVRLGACAAGAGRLCVRARGPAAAAAPALAALLADARAPLPARLNALLALTDICTRYTCIVEPLLPSVCGCLSSTAVAPLRRAAARALTRLLLAGYLRLRTPLYYRYCALLADDDHDVREPAEYYVTSCLTADTIYHHFVDCVIHYNKEDTEPISFDARQLIYDVMLQRLSLVQKLNVQCRLAREVLEHAADFTDECVMADADLPPALNATLLDTITLLCGPRMKLPKKPQGPGDAADIDDLQERVTKNIVSHKMKVTVAEVVVPAVLRLYSRLRARGGQLAAYLVRIATDLLNDYRHEIEELIENDEELIERVQQFQETIGLEPFGNARNLMTSSAPPEPETPRAPRRRAGPNREPAKKRKLRI